MINGLNSIPGTGGGAGIGGLPSGGIGAAPAPSTGPDDGGASFGKIFKELVITKPTASHHTADTMAASLAAGGDVDPHQLAIATAKAGVEIQMATRTISQAVSAVRTLASMQI